MQTQNIPPHALVSHPELLNMYVVGLQYINGQLHCLLFTCAPQFYNAADFSQHFVPVQNTKSPSLQQCISSDLLLRVLASELEIAQ